MKIRTCTLATVLSEFVCVSAVCMSVCMHAHMRVAWCVRVCACVCAYMHAYMYIVLRAIKSRCLLYKDV